MFFWIKVIALVVFYSNINSFGDPYKDQWGKAYPEYVQNCIRPFVTSLLDNLNDWPLQDDLQVNWDKIGPEHGIGDEVLEVRSRESRDLLIYADYLSEQNEIKINMINIVPKLKNRGISKLLFKFMMDRHPDTKVWKGTLALDNYLAFKKTISRSTWDEAFFNTPLGKVAKEYGFTKLTYLSSERELKPGSFGYDFTIEKVLESPLRIGLVPETARMKGVVVHNGNLSGEAIKDFFVPFLDAIPHDIQIFTMAPTDWIRDPAVANRVKRIPGIRPSSPWVRDYFPDVVIGEDKKPKLVSFKYRNNQEESTTEAVAKFFKAPYYESNLNLEGGNYLVDEDGNLFTTQKALKKNSWNFRETIMKDLNLKSVHILPNLSNESTGHIDMFAKYVGKKRFLVADSANKIIKAELDGIALILENLGYNVVRIKNQGDWHNSYTNSLLLNKTALVPKYAKKIDKWDFNPEDLKVDDAAKSVYEKLGFEVKQIPSDSVICLGGAVHCLTKQIPEILGSQ